MNLKRLNRFNLCKTIIKILEISPENKILDVGCGKKDRSFSCFNDENQITGLDVYDSTENDKNNFKYIKGDAEKLPFKNKEFEVIISIGMLEHIKPKEKMIKCLKEIERVGKKYAIVVPHRYGFIEPHFQLPFWYFYPEFLKRSLIKRFNLGSQPKKKDGNYQKLNHPPAKFYKKLLKGCKIKNYFFGPILLYYIIYKK
jgi:ubiquinone/menaquinone biosynthesis C-methylase UbiE